MSWITLIVQAILALAKAVGLAASAKQVAGERAAGAAEQRAEDLSNEANRIDKAARVGLAVGPANSKLPDPNDRDAAP
ncbi:MAG: hypothetical protein ABI230_12255 [Aestuariivirga sp.]